MSAMASLISNVLAMAYREFTVIRHDKAFLATVIMQPIMMLLLFGFALSNDPHNVPWAVLDRSQTAFSRLLIAEVTATGRFREPLRTDSYDEGRAWLRRGEAVVLLVIPPELRREVRAGVPEVQLLLDGADPLTAARVAGIVRQAAAQLGTRSIESARVDTAPSLRAGGTVDLRPASGSTRRSGTGTSFSRRWPGCY